MRPGAARARPAASSSLLPRARSASTSARSSCSLRSVACTRTPPELSLRVQRSQTSRGVAAVPGGAPAGCRGGDGCWSRTAGGVARRSPKTARSTASVTTASPTRTGVRFGLPGPGSGGTTAGRLARSAVRGSRGRWRSGAATRTGARARPPRRSRVRTAPGAAGAHRGRPAAGWRARRRAGRNQRPPSWPGRSLPRAVPECGAIPLAPGAPPSGAARAASFSSRSRGRPAAPPVDSGLLLPGFDSLACNREGRFRDLEPAAGLPGSRLRLARTRLELP